MLFFQLLRADLEILKTQLVEKFKDLIIWAVAITVVSGYILQGFGMPVEFASIQATGLFAAIISLELHGTLFELVADMTGRNHMGYLLTLPTRSNFSIIAAKATFYAINSMISVAIIFPLVKLMLYNRFDLSLINFPRFIFAIVLTSVFFGWMGLLFASQIKNMSQVRSTILRIVFPMWFLGCFSFSLKIAEKISPLLSKVCFLSPSTFATEAIRSAALGPEGYLPFWLSTSVLAGLTLVAAFFGYQGLKRRLDFV